MSKTAGEILPLGGVGRIQELITNSLKVGSYLTSCEVSISVVYRYYSVNTKLTLNCIFRGKKNQRILSLSLQWRNLNLDICFSKLYLNLHSTSFTFPKLELIFLSKHVFQIKI